MGERLDDCLAAQDVVDELEMDYPRPNMLTVGVGGRPTFLSAWLQVA